VTDEPLGPSAKPLPSRGLVHAVSAAAYSLAGLRRLLGEAAFRQELAFAAVLFSLFAALGAPLSSFGIQAILFLVLVAMEALNTAIEVLVDRISPGFAKFAGEAKDLGSLAVFCLVLANAGFALLVVWQCLA
jgi:diacylglycerol kinase (ATP)